MRPTAIEGVDIVYVRRCGDCPYLVPWYASYICTHPELGEEGPYPPRKAPEEKGRPPGWCPLRHQEMLPILVSEKET